VTSRRRDPYALDFGKYGLVPDGEYNIEYGLTIDDVEARVTRKRRRLKWLTTSSTYVRATAATTTPTYPKSSRKRPPAGYCRRAPRLR
jgi:hypothetical protein